MNSTSHGTPYTLNSVASHTSTLPHRRSRHLITRRNRPIEINQNPGIRWAIRAGERNQGGGASIPTARDGQLAAGEVELGTALATGGVQADVLDAEEVVAVWKGGGEGGCYFA